MEGRMRGSDATSGSLFSYVDLEERVPAKHPLRTIRGIVNDVLVSLDAAFERLYEGTGRQSVAPERLLRASLLQAFYSVRSERQLMEQIDYNLLFRWFVGLGIDDPVWDHSTFSKNRDRLLDADVAAKFLEAVLRHPEVKRFLSDDHFSVDGTLVEAWASLKSSGPRTAATDRLRWDVTASAIFMGKSAPMTRTKARPIPTPSSTARVTGSRRSSASWATR
jgi:transposase